MPRYGTARRLPRRRGAPFRRRPTPTLDAPDEGGLGASAEPRGVPGGLWGRAYGSAGCRTRCRARCRGKGCCLGRLTNNQPDIVVGFGRGPGEDFPYAVSGPARLARCATHGHVRQTRVRCRTGPQSSTTAESARTREAMFLTFCGAADMPSQSRPVETANDELEISSI
jgi:hypothetical protein